MKRNKYSNNSSKHLNSSPSLKYKFYFRAVLSTIQFLPKTFHLLFVSSNRLTQWSCAKTCSATAFGEAVIIILNYGQEFCMPQIIIFIYVPQILLEISVIQVNKNADKHLFCNFIIYNITVITSYVQNSHSIISLTRFT